MDEYIKELLRKNLEVSEESLKILRKMNRARVRGNIFKVIKWIIIIALSVGAYYYIEPYLRSLMDALSQISASMNQLRGVGGQLNPSNAPPGFFDNIKNLLPLSQ